MEKYTVLINDMFRQLLLSSFG